MGRKSKSTFRHATNLVRCREKEETRVLERKRCQGRGERQIFDNSYQAVLGQR